MTERFTFPKEEKLCSRDLIGRLFVEGDRTVSCFPFRIVYMLLPASEQTGASLLISVPKKRFKRAVKRNRVKRQVREMYRHSKQDLAETLEKTGQGMALAVIWCDDKLWPSDQLEPRFRSAMEKLVQKVSSQSV